MVGFIDELMLQPVTPGWQVVFLPDPERKYPGKHCQHTLLVEQTMQ
jgi:hypothetical protein